MKTARQEAAEERAAIQAVEREAEAAHFRAIHPPEPPQDNTGFYRCDGAFHWCGTGPHPEYRPPGLAWDRAWKQPKPADVPWLEDVQPKPPKVWASEPGPITARELADSPRQGRLF